ncbi:MAG: CTP synthase [Mycoplasmataceae bacterium]|nr:CTP synthase [Mycoplasmataceae bacterium]
MSKTNYIFVTGGVLSGLGKGVSAASLGRLLKARGFKIFVQKLDPYYNTDPGTMSPYQHGEVYVTDDGAETDLDLGHYERFIGEKFTKESNYTQGKILFELLNEEREGKFGGKTVQVVPHVTNKIKDIILNAGKKSGADFVITEIGGTVGDIESQPFYYAISQFARENVGQTMFLHATYIPYLDASKEFKSKPSQQSISLLQSMGVRPDIVLLRANKTITDEIVSKIANKTMIEESHCIPVPNVDNIYKVPSHFEKHQMAQKVLKHFGIEERKSDLKEWDEFVELIDASKESALNISMVGKYVEFEDAYKSVVEALKITAIWNKVRVNFEWIQSENLTKENIKETIGNTDGIIILPGFGKRGFDGKVIAAGFGRDNDIPTLGICYGFQAMVVDQAIRKGIKDATSSEVSKEGTFVIDIIRGKNENDKLGGTLRLGASTTNHVKGSLVSKLYNSDTSSERHRHRFEVAPDMMKDLEGNNFKFSGHDSVNNLADVCEVSDKKFFLGVQSHPEFNASPLKPHPLFEGFIKAIKKNVK